MKKLIFLLLAAVIVGNAADFNPVPSKIVGPSGSQISIADGNATIQPSSGGAVNVVTGTVYVPTVLDFSTSVSPSVSGAGHSSLAFDGTSMKISVGGASYSVFGSATWGAITGTLSSQSDLNTALSGKQSTITFGTGIQTALGVNTGSTGAPVLFNGAGGTPSSLTLTNATGLPNASVTGLGALATVTPGTGVATAAAIAVNTAGGPLTHGGAGSHTTLASSGATTFTANTASTTMGTGTVVVTGGIGLSGRVNSASVACGDGSINSGDAGGAGLSSFMQSGGGVNLRLVLPGVIKCDVKVNQSPSRCDFGDPDHGVIPLTLALDGTANAKTAGNWICTAAGTGLQLKSGTGARAGNATLVGGTVTVTNTTVTANSIIYCGRKTPGGTLGQSLSYSLSAGTSFTITSVDATGVLSALDTSVVSFIIVELN